MVLRVLKHFYCYLCVNRKIFCIIALIFYQCLMYCALFAVEFSGVVLRQLNVSKSDCSNFKLLFGCTRKVKSEPLRTVVLFLQKMRSTRLNVGALIREI